MTEKQFDSPKERVAFIMDEVPETRYNYLYLIVSYWQLFDGIDIPQETIQQIINQGTQPETIARSRRRALEHKKRLNEKSARQLEAQAKVLEEVE